MDFFRLPPISDTQLEALGNSAFREARSLEQFAQCYQ